MKILNQVFVRRILTKIANLIGLFAGLTLIASCQHDQPRSPETNQLTVGFYAGGVATRTVIGENGLSAAWEEGDKMAVWAKNSSGNYTLSRTVFGMYGVGGSTGVFSATLDAPMEEDRYMYMAAYPVPKNVQGTIASFDLSDEQDGKASGGSDIMIADPVMHGPLTSIPKPDDHSTMRLSMNHILHHLRFYVPEGTDMEGESVRDIFVTMPKAIAGTVKADLADPDAAATLVDGTNSVMIEMAQPISVSNGTSKDYAIMAMYTDGSSYGDDDYMQLTAYSKSYKFSVAPIALSGRTFLPGHSTPVRLVPTSKEKFFRVVMTMGMNNIGETVRKISIVDGDSEVYSYLNEDGKYSNIKIFEEFLGEAGEAGYISICNAVKGGSAKLVFETDHAIVEKNLRASDIAVDDNVARLDLGEVPYLLYENFDNALDSEENDSYSAGTSSDMNLGGHLLDEFMPVPGWNAARYKIIGGDAIRINCRYQSGAWVVGRYCGRLDTPAMSYIKPGVTVSVRIEYDNAFYVPAGMSYDDSNSDMAFYKLGTHELAVDSAINGYNYNDIDNNINLIYNSPQRRSEDISNMSHISHVVDGVNRNTRFAFFACTARNSSHIAANCVYYLYLDNIQVSIAQ